MFQGATRSGKRLRPRRLSRSSHAGRQCSARFTGKPDMPAFASRCLPIGCTHTFCRMRAASWVPQTRPRSEDVAQQRGKTPGRCVQRGTAVLPCAALPPRRPSVRTWQIRCAMQLAWRDRTRAAGARRLPASGWRGRTCRLRPAVFTDAPVGACGARTLAHKFIFRPLHPDGLAVGSTGSSSSSCLVSTHQLLEKLS